MVNAPLGTLPVGLGLRNQHKWPISTTKMLRPVMDTPTGHYLMVNEEVIEKQELPP